MRVTLTKHRGHGAKPLSRENKEILSSFVRRGGLCLCLPGLSPSLPTFISARFSLSLTFIYFYSRVSRVIASASAFTLIEHDYYVFPALTHRRRSNQHPEMYLKDTRSAITLSQ